MGRRRWVVGRSDAILAFTSPFFTWNGSVWVRLPLFIYSLVLFLWTFRKYVSFDVCNQVSSYKWNLKDFLMSIKKFQLWISCSSTSRFLFLSLRPLRSRISLKRTSNKQKSVSCSPPRLPQILSPDLWSPFLVWGLRCLWLFVVDFTILRLSPPRSGLDLPPVTLFSDVTTIPIDLLVYGIPHYPLLPDFQLSPLCKWHGLS